MATTAVALSLTSSCLRLRPLSGTGTGVRRNPGNPKKPSQPNPNSLKSRPRPGGAATPPQRSLSSGAGEATTYTRLPPRDDGFSSLDPSIVIKLRESAVPGLDSAEKKPRGRRAGSSLYGGKPKGAIFVEEIDEDDAEELLEFKDNVGFSSRRSAELVGTEISVGDFAGRKLTGGGSFGREKDNAKASIFVEEIEEEEEEDDDDDDLVFESEDDEMILSYEEDGSDSERDDEIDASIDEEEDELKDGDIKEKGVPAIMRCFDRAKIYVKAGDGGNGVVAFRREKFVPLGGPSGGDGGRGGNVYVEVDGAMNSLLPFRKHVHFRAERGAHGQGRQQAGAKGEDVVVKVAPGTVIREAGKGGSKGEVLLEMMRPGQRALLLPGGRGGRGNAAFKSGTNKVPKIAENGEKGAEMWLDLELKLVADVGIVGAPNAGKSTLLSAISAAQPTIANYPFTTLLPNLGVVSLDFDATMVVADLPGLLEGAHRGFGLGHEFLRHTERCSVLVHVVDGSGQQPEYEFDAVRLELELFSPELAEKPYVVVFNKMDLPEAYEGWDKFNQHLQNRGVQAFSISAMNRQGTRDVVLAAYELLREEKEAKKHLEEFSEESNLNHVADAIRKQRSSSMNEFEIFHDNGSNTWHVVGAGLQRFVQMTNWQYSESLRRFQHALEACGVNRALIKHGVKEGDTVIVGEMEMLWQNETEGLGSSGAKRRATGSVKWPTLD